VSRGLPRVVEIALAAGGLVTVAPLLVGAALAVKLTSPGPALFRQQRVGRDGALFTLMKLRTMRMTSGGAAVTARGDARITPLGRLLRKTKLDELPELLNILLGDMSFVGPRPEVPRYVDLQDARWRAVLAVRPGLTDPVTLRLRNEEELMAEVPAADREEFYSRTLLGFKLRGYQEYLARRSWSSDVEVLLRTLLVVAIPASVPPPTPDELRRAAASPDA
jgi:lipopolysaccharide/colanic/teichoic acid biosynthesis glycosyltransferase